MKLLVLFFYMCIRECCVYANAKQTQKRITLLIRYVLYHGTSISGKIFTNNKSMQIERITVLALFCFFFLSFLLSIYKLLCNVKCHHILCVVPLYLLLNICRKFVSYNFNVYIAIARFLLSLESHTHTHIFYVL